MTQTDYITAGIEKRGSLAALARYLDQAEATMRDARNLKRGLPTYACVSLAKLLDVPPMEIIAASELVTAKTEERRALFLPFVQTAKNLHRSMIAGLAGLIVLAEKAAEGAMHYMSYI
jgi:lambda repressor-like predicted transcriptional regulator